MALRIYNSLTRQKETFKPLKNGEVRIYVCGPTVYDEPHIGHLRSAVVFEVMRRYLKHSGYGVKFVRNVTDVDDKIIEKARASGAGDLAAETRKVSQKYCQSYTAELETLGVSPPDEEPRATAHIGEMIRLIERLIEKGAAYPSGGDVYFDISQYPDYGKLSGQKKDAMLEGTRVDASENKKNPLDFALWKKAKEGEPFWPSPWGNGRPGWHIECSAMSMKYLGESFDIHGGGRDLIFPHHENEIAQSECATGTPFVKTWIHHGLVTVNGQKMSKSLKNVVTLGMATQGMVVRVEALKFFFLGTHYSAPLDYSDEKMQMERAVFQKFKLFYDDACQFPPGQSAKDEKINQLKTAFMEAMDDDFNTPQALAVLHEIMHYARQKNDPAIFHAAHHVLKECVKPLGLDFGDRSGDHSITGEIRRREEAKKKGDYKLADAIRASLLEKGVVIRDLPGGVTAWTQT
ncbi:MAG: cysteine--tRNA ligase [Candidatus Omnitrophica bacterium]|nr:cysteine--tRNA ligase [Candidatus Omnitrophota bacterium]